MNKGECVAELEARMETLRAAGANENSDEMLKLRYQYHEFLMVLDEHKRELRAGPQKPLGTLVLHGKDIEQSPDPICDCFDEFGCTNNCAAFYDSMDDLDSQYGMPFGYDESSTQQVMFDSEGRTPNEAASQAYEDVEAALKQMRSEST